MLKLAYVLFLTTVMMLGIGYIPGLWPQVQAAAPFLAGMPAWAAVAAVLLVAAGAMYAVTTA